MLELVYLILITIGAILLANGGLILTRRSNTISRFEDHNDVAGFIYAVVGVIYGVLLAFVVSAVWEIHRNAETSVSNEKRRIMNLYLNANSLPENIKKPVQTEIKNYVKLVINKEWEEMAQNGYSKEAERSFHHIRKILHEYKPQSNFENIWYNKAIEALINLGDYRNMRLGAGRQKIPDYMWMVLIVGGILAIGFSLLFGTKNLWAQIVMVSLLTATVVLTLTLIWALESPFSGVISVEPDALKTLAKEFAVK